MFIYNLVVLLYGLVIRLASIKKLKAKQWVQGRKNWKQFYSQQIDQLNSTEIIWIHCASYGEFEQGRPLIEKIKKDYPGFKVVLTFFSPSGYEVMKDWKGADVIGYLPLDTGANARTFISIVKPRAAIFIKYEFWLNFLNTLKEQGVKTYLVSAVFKEHHPFFKWYGKIFRDSLTTFNKLFIQDEASGELLKTIGIKNYEVTGDTRFDRVIEIKEKFEPVPLVENFCGDSQIIVAGSTWYEDEILLAHVFRKLPGNIKLIIAPHEITEDSIQKLVSVLKERDLSYALYSNDGEVKNKQVLIVNTFGLLSKLYHYCSVAYIGGGFGDGIHNCLEAAVYLKPVIFYGNTHQKYNEAVELIELGAAKNVMSEDEAVNAFSRFLVGEPAELKKSLQTYFNDKSGTTQKVMDILKLS